MSAPAVRVNVNAVVVRGEDILLIEFDDASGKHFNLPGGGLDSGESVEEALIRECREEACAEVEVERMLLIWEYEPERENFQFGQTQKVGLVFLCRLKPGSSEPRLPAKPDPNQVGVRWVPLASLESAPTPARPPILPSLESEILKALRNPGAPVRISANSGRA